MHKILRPDMMISLVVSLVDMKSQIADLPADSGPRIEFRAVETFLWYFFSLSQSLMTIQLSRVDDKLSHRPFYVKSLLAPRLPTPPDSPTEFTSVCHVRIYDVDSAKRFEYPRFKS